MKKFQKIPKSFKKFQKIEIFCKKSAIFPEPERPWPVSGISSCIPRDPVPSVTGPSDPDTTDAKAVAIGIADTGQTDIDLTKLEVGGPDPAQPDAGLEDTGSSDAGSTCIEHADDGSAAVDTDSARIDIGPMEPDPALAAGTGPEDGPGSN